MPGESQQDKARFAVAHEFGHRADVRLYPDWASAPAAKARQADARQNYGIESKGRVSLPDREYDDTQYGADTFATAFQFLQSPQSRTSGAATVLADLEKKQPGATAIAYRLLRMPLYSKHPLAMKAIAPSRP